MFFYMLLFSCSMAGASTSSSSCSCSMQLQPPKSTQLPSPSSSSRRGGVAPAYHRRPSHAPRHPTPRTRSQLAKLEHRDRASCTAPRSENEQCADSQSHTNRRKLVVVLVVVVPPHAKTSPPPLPRGSPPRIRKKHHLHSLVRSHPQCHDMSPTTAYSPSTSTSTSTTTENTRLSRDTPPVFVVGGWYSRPTIPRENPISLHVVITDPLIN